MSENKNHHDAPDNVVHFPKRSKPHTQDRKSARERACEEELARDARVFQFATEALDRGGLMSPEVRFLLAKNLRDFVYRLQREGRMRVRDLAAEVRGPHTPREVRAVNEYFAPIGVETEEECRAKHPKRRIAGKAKAFKRLALAAARLAGVEERDAILELVRGSPFWPDAPAVTEDRRQAANQVASVLALLRRPLDAIYPLEKYFDDVEEHRIVPHEDPNGPALIGFGCEAYGEDHLRIPCVPVAWGARKRCVTMYVEAKEGDVDDVFRAALDAGECKGFACDRISYFSVGVARLGRDIRPVGIITFGEWTPQLECESIEFPDYDEPGRFRRDGVDYFWVFAEFEYDLPEAAVVRPLTADFLMEAVDGDWQIGSSWKDKLTQGPDEWRAVADRGHSRLGGPSNLASIIERAVTAQGEDGTLVKELEASYRDKVEALAAWRRDKFGEIERGLERVRSQLLDVQPLTSGAPTPPSP